MSEAPFVFTTTSSVLMLVFCPNPLVVLARQAQQHQHESPASPARNITIDVDMLRFLLSVKREFTTKRNKYYNEFKGILSKSSQWLSLHFTF
jgi:hypothetical protein